MTEPIDIFVGADRSQLLAVAVLQHSIERHTTAPVRLCPLIDLDIPEPDDVRHGSRTNFSFARFAIPALKAHQGKAIYLDADMLVFRDIRKLWDLPLSPQLVNVQEELPEHAVRGAKAGAPKTRVRQCSVMVIDCARTGWDVHEIVRGLGGRYTYEQLMQELCILDPKDIRSEVPFHWNSLEHYDLDTHLIHYTDMNTQPWVSPMNANGELWLKEVLLMLEIGALTWEDVRTEITLGYFRPSLEQELREMPHARGFDQGASERYAAIDKAAGFVKHKEVNARKLERAAAVKALRR
jgi:lipopolysaccharide biosynthesis glycosyltransferase